MKSTYSLIPLFLGASLSAQELTTEPAQESLSPILMFVADRSSADAAAPRIRALIERVGAEHLRVDNYDLQLLRSTGCFGSTDLQSVMTSFITALSEKEVAELRPFLTVCSDMCQSMDDLSETLKGVHDKRSADMAAEMADSFRSYMASCSERVAALPQPSTESARMELNLKYRLAIRRSTASLLQVWGELALRSPEYYESERLVEGLMVVRDVLENMNMQVDPSVIPGVMKAAGSMQSLMQQWIAVISLVRDKDSADAAAVQLTRLRRELATVAMHAGVSRSYEEDLFLFHPILEVKAHVIDRVAHYLQEEVTPAYYGSESLRKVLEHED